MSARSNSISATDDVRCDRCGYRLQGLEPDGRCPECGLAIRASIEARKPRQRAPESGLKPQYFVLIMLLAGYGLANLLSIALVRQEIVHPPEAALWFFMHPGPILGIIVLLSYQALAGSRRFNWLVVPAVLAAMILAAYLSLRTLGWAYQGV